MRALAAAAAIGVLTGIALAMHLLVLEPAEQNRLVKRGHVELARESRLTPAAIRGLTGALESAGRWDPYLYGEALVLRARGYAALGRMDAASELYDAALEQRVLPETIVEAALHHAHAGDTERALELLLRATRYSPALTMQFPDPALAAELQRIAEREALLNR